MQTFIRVIEIWLPSPDRTRLVLGDGLYGPLGGFRAASERISFAYGEGLPGRAWAARHPIILKDLQTSYFLRGEAAQAAGLTCAVALPVLAGDILLAVVVFLCGDDEAHVGAIELWRNDARENTEMSLVDGYYGTADAFGWLSQNTRFMRGFGLPGLAWQAGLPVAMADLGRAHGFLRWEGAVKVGLNKGMAFPYPDDGSGLTWVLAFISAQGTPIARRFEIWLPDEARASLVLQVDDGGAEGSEAEEGPSISVPRGEGLVGRAWSTCAPVVAHATGAGSGDTAPGQAESGAAVAIPFLREARLSAVVVWRF
ncbi:GAF domain-containing protein [Roseomonas sp. NAR14]|uniref:GAF domain-containing protein n=1 Tax=Roseomonas acroporae TaxID=2937791 RepID=A0A9X1YA09_9PROT|nr:GAF domain-containing protein [Roseomonas acroporae]MCK8785120.1 GAF domain-containing protein [Roseomonas acroporae]